ncbi:uncharacterized protein EDB91DRAFT_1086645 [Suillus paluster]|uniref:uncharacterized protein n=1 Tax=Suillus paluster TaxID=48578 RepID=UPI001B874CA9|nr:uncharacterized protein EDB91DRAFT_1086645 [Suillus paluster]KAG1726788.1 hypothetical protein EDB91DRAFT_1086645 [Suillus paluster]
MAARQSKAAAAQLRETHKARMQAQLQNVSVADTADNMELDEPSTGQPCAAKTVVLTRPDRPIKHKQVRKEPANIVQEPTSTVQAPASLPKGKHKHANSVVEVRKASNASKVQPSEALHQCEVKKVKLMPKLISGNKCSNPKVKDGTTESDLRDLDEDGEDRDEQDSLDDDDVDDDEDEEFADLAVENFGEEGVQWTQKNTTNQVNVALDNELEDEQDSMRLKKAKQHKSKSTTREKKLQDEMPHFADDTE